MKILKMSIDMDFTATALQEAIRLIRNESSLVNSFKLLLSCAYNQREVIEMIFRVRMMLDIPFEFSSVLPEYSWVLLDADNSIFCYSDGVRL